MNIVAKMATTWARALRLARVTIGKADIGKEPSDEWKSRMLLSEHSPIRAVEYDIDIDGVRQWVTVHIARHHEGVEKFVHSQREDRRVLDCSRDELPQGTLNDMTLIANAQGLINISRKRLCNCASKETRECWEGVKDAVAIVDPIMASKMVRECLYRGFCPELKPCGFAETEKYFDLLKEYRK